ncbi:MAG: 5,10-methylenetetrahydrofolate reductase, partial [Candidatus Omnitrophica bacterium]|nr:5,10-methylenetetrahydrofolate reductase [Candidatus Omnitrophota bacterium]
MIITESKPLQDIVDSLKSYTKIFLVGCGECATTCKTGGEPEILKMKQELELQGKIIIGYC